MLCYCVLDADKKKTIMRLLDKHPFDWIIHLVLCFVPLWRGWATWFVVGFVAVMMEYEQWKWSKQKFTWEYFYYNCLGDLIADIIGIIGGSYVKK